jgi:hypothetical protein
MASRTAAHGDIPADSASLQRGGLPLPPRCYAPGRRLAASPSQISASGRPESRLSAMTVPDSRASDWYRASVHRAPDQACHCGQRPRAAGYRRARRAGAHARHRDAGQQLPDRRDDAQPETVICADAGDGHRPPPVPLAYSLL